MERKIRGMKLDKILKTDKKIAGLIKKEIERQAETIDLIASENIASEAVLEALGSPLVNKYSEGYPGKRYYPGNVYYDEIEEEAKRRALKLFGLSDKLWGVNVQPYSGSPANLAVYLGLMKPGEILMGMSLACGGHLTHGHGVSVTGQIFKSVQYGLNERGEIDYQELEKLAKQYKPKVIVSGATAYAREINFKKIGQIAKGVGAYQVADISHIAGLVAAKEHPAPFLYAEVVTMTTHKTLRGPRGAIILARKEKEILEKINKAIFPGLQGGPHNNQTAAIAVALEEAGKPSFKKYQEQTVKNAKVLAWALQENGFELVGRVTENHLMLLNLNNTGFNGTEAEKRLEAVGILANRNAISGDKKPWRPSGLRIGTPAVTSRGMKEKEMREIADIVTEAIIGGANKELRGRVKKLTKKFPIKY